MTADRRLMFVHAHPDDETSQTGATLARYAAAGDAVTLVTCTLGEKGEIVDETLTDVTQGESLGRHRIGELTRAMAHLGVTDFLRLGGDGRFHDSGMESDHPFGLARAPEDLDPASFWSADLLEAALELVPVIRDRRPQVLVTYDPFGGYGHPDHVQAHRVAMYAAELASAPYRLDLGGPWAVQRIFWSTMSVTDMVAMFAAAKEAGVPLPWDVGPDAELPPMLAPDEVLAVRIPAGPYLANKVAALREHRSQVNMDDPFWAFLNASVEPGPTECYILAMGTPMPGGGISDDLFAGLTP